MKKTCSAFIVISLAILSDRQMLTEQIMEAKRSAVMATLKALF